MQSTTLPQSQAAASGMPALARHVASQGRGQDKVLVHMTPGEVQGLQYLAMRHGGSLTVNPQTGLVEAGFLSSILPMIAGAALAPLTAGTSLAFLGSPMAAGLLVGGVTGLATGSLKKGLMAGLGAFGGAGIGSALAGAGSATAPIVTGTEAGLTSAGEMAASNVAPEVLNAGTGAGVIPDVVANPGVDMAIQTPPLATAPVTTAGAGSPYFQAAQSNIDPGLLEGMNAQQVASAPVLNATPGVAPSPTVGLTRMGEGIKNIAGFGTPEQADIARTRFMTDVGGITGLATKAAPAVIGAMSADEGKGPAAPETFIRPFKYDAGYQGNKEDFEFRTGERGEPTSELSYFDQKFTPVGVYKPGKEPAYGTYALGGRIDFDETDDGYYGGGLTALAAGGKTLPPRYLEGDGDGMSDSIKARIGGVQEARLADGEFVIPADVVSHIGNGSSNAGAKKLHAMMDRIRNARTGKKRQAPEVNTLKYMPA